MEGFEKELKQNKGKGKSGSFIKELLSGSMVTEKIILNNLWYVLLLTLLAAIYIGNRFHAEKITRETTRLEREVKELRAESLATSADLMYISRQSEVLRLVKEKGLGLEELKSPPYKLLVERK
ncbi:MAG TPA: FtsL-like putative cell division protein [Bacteroidales bacterium]|jgi:cell division protein FtsL|nr:FtsL-like putative cell division protein [Bacteroidales bacterium]